MEQLFFAIALTGGIGTGKSTVASLLKLYGFSVIDADLIAHTHLKKEQEAIVKLFGEEILEQGEISRQKLGAIVFADAAKRATLESLLHPKIREEILREAQILEKREVPYFIEIPLFFEKQAHYAWIPRSLLVYAPKKLQKERIMARNKLTEEAALQRLSAQQEIETKRALATYIIENTGDLESLTRAIETLITRLDKEAPHALL